MLLHAQGLIDNARRPDPCAVEESLLNYPQVHSEIVAYGPFALRWYGLAYLAGFVCAWWFGVRRARQLAGWDGQGVADLIFYAAMGVIVGGRLGYVLFYGLETALRDPLWIFKIWSGGMSFHGGMLGVIAALWLFARQTGRRWFEVTDFAAPLVPPGLFFGRLGNFVNTELPGRVTDVPWGLHYPCWAVQALNDQCGAGFEAVARHPSPLYQAGLEGIVLGAILWLFVARPRPLGSVSGLFLLVYGLLRLISEQFRQPDAGLGFALAGVITRGQLLSAPMVLGGIGLMLWGFFREQPPARILAAEVAVAGDAGAAGRTARRATSKRRR